MFNYFLNNSLFSGIIKYLLGFAPERNVPLLYKTTLSVWVKNYTQIVDSKKGKVFLFADEFSNFNDVELGIKAVKLLNKAGFEVGIPVAVESGRTFLSKGLIRKAKKIANKNIVLLKDRITKETPLIGIEPSAILTFRDEYPELVDSELKTDALNLAENTLLFDEFFVNISNETAQPLSTLFTRDRQTIKLHGHCQQKALVSMDPTIKMLSYS